MVSSDELDELFEPDDCSETYDSDRTAGSILFVAGEIDLPHGWTADDATVIELTPEWHEPVCAAMRSERIEVGDDIRSYPKRQAILALEIFNSGPWPLPGRNGTAYSVLLLGMWGHHFVARPDEPAVDEVMNPSEDFFETYREKGVDALGDLLQRAFVHRTELRRRA